MKKRILIAVCAILLLTVLLLAAGELVRPKYKPGSASQEGGLIAEYYRSTFDHDVLFIGDCEVYESFVPAVLWEEYGIRSYVRGSAQQLTWQSYYLLEDTLQYETPKTVVFNVLALKYGTPQNEAYNRMTLDGMRWSFAKWQAIRASMTADEHMLDYLFPLLRYHSRITSLSSDDFEYFGRSASVSHNGYLMQAGIAPMSEEVYVRGLSDYTLPKTSMDYLEKMRALCEKKDIELVLVKAPTNSWGYWWYDEWDEQVRAYAEEHTLSYYNFIEESDDIGLDWKTDTYDAGVHLNVYGAEKMTRYFGTLLCERHGYDTDVRADAEWDAMAARYREQKQALEEERKRTENESEE